MKKPNPLKVVKTFPSGSKMQPGAEAPDKKKGYCKFCGGKGIRTSSKGRVRYYRCSVCVDPKTADWTRWKEAAN